MKYSSDLYSFKSVVVFTFVFFSFWSLAAAQSKTTTAAPSASGGNGNGSLSSVTHDATMTGSGTAASPLGVAASGITTLHLADGSVTASKVATGAITSAKIVDGAVDARKLADGSVNTQKLAAGTPQAGQVLTSNGTSLSWQTISSGGPLRYVDANNNEVGVFLSDGQAIHYLASDDIWTVLPLNRGSISDDYLQLYFESPDCTGNGYIDQRVPPFIQNFRVYLGNIYLPSPSIKTINYGSDLIKVKGNPDVCNDVSSYGLRIDVATSYTLVPIGQFNNPPFRLVR